MRYLVQLAVMGGDVLLFIAVIVILYYGYDNPLAWGLVIAAYYTWKRAGAFDAWRPSVMRKFLKNAKSKGL
jgi:hypothetical protein